MSETHGSVDTASETPVRTVVIGARGWSRFLIVALALHIPLFIYPILRLCSWLALAPWLTLLVFIPLVSSQIVSRVYLRRNVSRWARWARLAADFWLGVSPLVLIALLFFEIPVAAGVIAAETAAMVVISFALLCGFVGLIVAVIPVVKKIRFNSCKLKAPVRFVQISDVHIGSRSQSFLESIVRKINQLEPDFVCITGDFIDASDVTESTLQSLRSIVGPVYFSIGNHEKYEDLDEILRRMKNLGVISLRNDQMLFRDDIQIIGIDDMDDAMQVKRQLQSIEVSESAFVVLMYHRPRGLEAAAEADIDLMLSGHTHNGQIFPFNFVVSRVFDKHKGLYEHGNSRLYVSQGTGTWGPVMRLGTQSEITLFEIDNSNP